MHIFRLFSGFAFFFLCATSTRAEVLGGPIYNAATGHAYYILSTNSWSNSELEAMSLGGHLVTINNAAEQDWVYATFARFNGEWRNLWTGLNDAAQEGSFVWASGEAVTYSNWFTEEPNNAGGAENYAEISYGRGGKWNDVPNSWVNQPWPLNNGVVEVIPLPAPKEIGDANAGLTIIRTSPLHSSGIFDARDAFGGSFGNSDADDVLFSDTEATNFVHFIEWRTAAPVTVKSIRLFTGAGDPAGREFSSFVLRAKPIGGSTFSAILYRHTPSHPYVLLPNGALFEGNVAPTTAQEFRAEFSTYPSQTARGPRIIELDGFDQSLPINFEPITAQLAVLIKWPPGATNNFQVHCRPRLIQPRGLIWGHRCALLIRTLIQSLISVGFIGCCGWNKLGRRRRAGSCGLRGGESGLVPHDTGPPSLDFHVVYDCVSDVSRVTNSSHH